MSEWEPIATAPKDGTQIMVGKWFIDDSGTGYFNGDQWYWMVMGSFDEDGELTVCFTDDQYPANKLTHWHEPTHWKPLELSPPNKFDIDAELC